MINETSDRKLDPAGGDEEEEVRMPSYGAIASYAMPAGPVAYGIAVDEQGPWALFISVVLLVLIAMVRGDLVPRKTHEDAIHQGQMWQAAHMISEQARQEERDQKKELLEIGRTNAAIIASLPKIATGEET